MTIHVKFFASLKDKLNLEDTTVEQANTAGQAWDIATDNADRPSNVLVAINLEYAQFDDTIKAGDEVAFFPPVTGG
ncbi:MAG: MoaD/ThiS family protein [Gammaproteobacteria bacterium]|jgi:molybdopterin synthase sulfur carrier subunit|nr:MoaD/ThiS family protein [Gammaproteobacteria bacterium]